MNNLCDCDLNNLQENMGTIDLESMKQIDQLFYEPHLNSITTSFMESVSQQITSLLKSLDKAISIPPFILPSAQGQGYQPYVAQNLWGGPINQWGGQPLINPVNGPYNGGTADDRLNPLNPSYTYINPINPIKPIPLDSTKQYQDSILKPIEEINKVSPPPVLDIFKPENKLETNTWKDNFISDILASKHPIDDKLEKLNKNGPLGSFSNALGYGLFDKDLNEEFLKSKLGKTLEQMKNDLDEKTKELEKKRDRLGYLLTAQLGDCFRKGFESLLEDAKKENQ